MRTLYELKRRKLVQWALAYLAGAWVVLQLLDIVAEPWGIGDDLLLAAQVVLAFGFCVTLVLAWYHGEQGRQRVSGPELLMLTALLVIAGSVIALVRGQSTGRSIDAAAAGRSMDREVTQSLLGPDSVSERSIAVLPLENHSPAEGDDYLADAMTEEITSALAKVPALRVTSRASASMASASGTTVREFALTRLGVAYVLEGSVERVGDRVRITVQLIDARTDDHLWSETYERELVDVMDVEAEIARQVADRLATSLTDQTFEQIRARATDDPVANELYLRAVAINSLEPGGLDRKVDLLRRAVVRDSTFWLAWGNLAGLYHRKAHMVGASWDDSAVMALDRAAAVTDVPSVRELVDAMRTMWTADDEASKEEAVARLRAAAAADPSNVLLAAYLAVFYVDRDRLAEAVRWMRRAARLDPLGGRADFWQGLANLYWDLGLFDLAERVLEHDLEIDPDEPNTWVALANVRFLDGRYEAAHAALDSVEALGVEARDLLGQYGPLALQRGLVYLFAGDVESAHASFERMSAAQIRALPFDMAAHVAHARLAVGDSAGGRRILKRVEARLDGGGTSDGGSSAGYELFLAAIRDDGPAAAAALRRLVESGGWSNNYIWITRDPLFSGVRKDAAFRAELDRLEARIRRMRRQVERQLKR